MRLLVLLAALAATSASAQTVSWDDFSTSFDWSNSAETAYASSNFPSQETAMY